MYRFSIKGKFFRSRGISAFFVAGVLLICAGSSYAQTVNAVYVESNISTANQNSVFGFSNDGLGNLTQLPGSPFLTGGTGFNDPTGTSIGTDHQVIINGDGSLLYAVNAFSNNISVLKINSDATLTPIAGSPFNSRGIEPISLALSDLTPPGETLTVVNRAVEPGHRNAVPNFSTFLVSPTGALSPITSAALAPQSYPTQVTSVGPNGRFLIGNLIGSTHVASKVFSYDMLTNGGLDFVSQQGEPGAAFIGNVAHPTQPFLYVGRPTIPQAYIRVYTWNTNTGALSYVREVTNAGKSVCWVAINASGTRIYAIENLSGSISVYDTSVPSAPVEVQRFFLSGTGSGPTNAGVDPTGNFLYVVDVGQQDLHVLNVNPTTGALSETVAPTPLPGLVQGSPPIGLASVLK